MRAGERSCDVTFTVVIHILLWLSTFATFISSVLVRIAFQYLKLIVRAEKH